MKNPAATRLQLDAHRTTLAADPAPEVVLPLGPSDIADGLFHHDPPTPLEMEQAIDVVEDALTGSRLQHAERGELVTTEALLQAWMGAAGPRGDDARLSRDEVEAIFQRLASASLGDPRALAGLPVGRDAAAALLIVRECMHHLGFRGIRLGAK